MELCCMLERIQSAPQIMALDVLLLTGILQSAARNVFSFGAENTTN